MRSRPKILSYSVSSPLVDALFSSFEVFRWKIKVWYKWEITENRYCQFSISIGKWWGSLLYYKLSRDNKWFSRHFEMNESQFTKTSSGSFMIDKDLIMCTSEKNNATFSSSLYPTITSQSLSQWAGRHYRWKKYPNLLRYTEGTGLMWGFRNLFQKFKLNCSISWGIFDAPKVSFVKNSRFWLFLGLNILL